MVNMDDSSTNITEWVTALKLQARGRKIRHIDLEICPFVEGFKLGCIISDPVVDNIIILGWGAKDKKPASDIVIEECVEHVIIHESTHLVLKGLGEDWVALDNIDTLRDRLLSP